MLWGWSSSVGTRRLFNTKMWWNLVKIKNNQSMSSEKENWGPGTAQSECRPHSHQKPKSLIQSRSPCKLKECMQKWDFFRQTWYKVFVGRGVTSLFFFPQCSVFCVKNAFSDELGHTFSELPVVTGSAGVFQLHTPLLRWPRRDCSHPDVSHTHLETLSAATEVDLMAFLLAAPMKPLHSTSTRDVQI